MINMSMKNIYTCFNILDLILKQFDNVKLWKSKNVWATKNTFYIFCYGFNKDKKIDLTPYIHLVSKHNETADFNTKYVGTSDNFKKINHMMNEIYMVRINAWLDKLNTEDSQRETH